MATKTHEERVEDMQLAIKAGVPLVKSPLAAAFLEDEAVRHTAEETARQYVLECEAYKNEMPNWMYCALYFVLGVLFDISVLGLSEFFWKYINGKL